MSAEGIITRWECVSCGREEGQHATGCESLIVKAVGYVPAGELAQVTAEHARMASALRLIAAPERPDGSWNRDREACRQLAEETLKENGAR